MDFKLSKPLTVGDKALTSLTLDFDALTGADYGLCEREALTENGHVPALDARLSPAMQAHLAARASGVDVETLRKMGIRDYARLLSAVRDFLIGSD